MKDGIRKVVVSVLLAAMLIGGGQGVFTTTLFTEKVAVAEDGIITPFADVLEWRYKDVDGKLYRRLYNRTTNQWMTEWEYCP